MSEGPPLIAARGVRKTYHLEKRALEVLRGIDLTVAAGEFLALRGASGAGKSTLLHLIGGLDLPTAGGILFGSTNLRSLGADALARWRNRSVGLIFQSYHLLPELSALENVMLPARMARLAGRDTETRARSLLQRVGLGERLEHRPTELSGGEQQRVAIARALVNEPVLILADEPTGNLDSKTGLDIIRLLADLRAEKGATLIMATHDDHIAAHAARSVSVADGQIVGG